MEINRMQSEIAPLARKYGLRLVVLFGSQAEGKTHKKSDIDIAFFPGKRLNEEALYEETLYALRREDVDLVNLLSAHNHLLRYEILSKGVTLFEAEKGLQNRMKWQSYFDFMDFQKYYLMRSRLLGTVTA